MTNPTTERMRDWRVLCTGGSGFIGSHLCNNFAENGIEFVNLDKCPPRRNDLLPFWRRSDILDFISVNRLFQEFQPTHVVHLAARASTEGESLDDFKENTIGTSNILGAIKHSSVIERVIVTSTQHVFTPTGRPPKDDFEFNPLGLYGQSKVVTEQITRDAGLSCCWTIVRPTTIWGPWHPNLPTGLWHIMKKGWYLHPKRDPVIRAYGYVKNSAWQIARILDAPVPTVNGNVFYLGDTLMDQILWVDAFSRVLTGRGVRLVPKNLIQLLALIGDFSTSLGLSFPMQSDRFRNMTTSNPVPLDPILDNFGPPPYSLDEGIYQTVEWLRSTDNFYRE